jgi:outer membrane lipoprotein-sorting protein
MRVLSVADRVATTRLGLLSTTLLVGILSPAACAVAQQDYVARSLAAYSALESYSDTATVDTEFQLAGGPVIRERHTFATRFRKPRHYYLEFNEDQRAGGDRFVVWSDDRAFKTWWATTGIEETYPPGQGVGALVQAFGVTNQAAAIVTPLLFPQANLRGGLSNFEGGAFEATESIDGRACHRVKGAQRSAYATGRGEHVRDTTLWIDAETFLLCRIFEDTPRGTTAGAVQRTTTTFQTQANPELADEHFKFTVPGR